MKKHTRLLNVIVQYRWATAAHFNLDIDKMEAITGSLQDELSLGGDFKLDKALYGLKPSSRVWNQKLDTAMKKFGLD